MAQVVVSSTPMVGLYLGKGCYNVYLSCCHALCPSYVCMFLDKELLIDNSLLMRDLRQHFLAYPKYSSKPFSFWLPSNTSDSKHLIQISLRGTFSIPKNIRRGLCCCSNIFLVVPTLFLLDLILDGKRMGYILMIFNMVRLRMNF
jgi:hypothetical protein